MLLRSAALRYRFQTWRPHLCSLAQSKLGTPCLWQTARTLASSSPSTAEKPYYITTPIFYVNAEPHVGHLYSMVIADALKRWQLIQGRNALLCTGTDEHGMKVQRAAHRVNIDPKSFCDRGAQVFLDLAELAGIAHDYFIRTTDQAHVQAVQHAWNVLNQQGYIYLSKHEGWYSVSDETYYPQAAVHLIVDPPTGRKIMASIETGKEVEWTSETNYCFRLSAFRDRLMEHYKAHPNFVVPRSRMREIEDAVSSGLQDLSVSRPSARLDWGIPVPGDSSQTIYVWLDALVNYVTTTGYPWPPDRARDGGWPADVHVIGKDITRFHCIYWPAFLMALDVPLPKQILAHAHWTLGREKMSKSTGNVVNPFFAIERFGNEVMRYFFSHSGGLAQDADYDNSYIIERYKTDLQGGLGNLTSRVTRGKGWSIAEAVQGADEMRFEDELTKMHHKRLLHARKNVADRFDKLDIKGAMKEITTLIYDTNAFFQATGPWALATEAKTSPEARARLNSIIYLSSESLRILGILLQPFMPERSERLLLTLGVPEGARRSLSYAQVGMDKAYGRPLVELGRGAHLALFPPLIGDD